MKNVLVALVWLLLWFGLVAAALTPTPTFTPSSMEEFWKHYPMPTLTQTPSPTPAQTVAPLMPMMSPTPSATPMSKGHKEHHG